MKEFLLERSPTGVEHWAYVDDSELITVEHTPSAVDQEIVDHAKTLRSLTQRKSEMRHAATVPINLYTKWRQEWQKNHSDVWTWKTFLVMKLNSSEFELLRTGVRRLPSHRHV